MRPLSWSADLVRGLKLWQRVVLTVCLCALAVPLWFAAKNTYRFFDGHRTTTEGPAICRTERTCLGTWRLPGGQRGSGEIDGLPFELAEEVVPDVPVFAGRDWAVYDRSDLMGRAVEEFACTLGGTALALWIASVWSGRNFWSGAA